MLTGTTTVPPSGARSVVGRLSAGSGPVTVNPAKAAGGTGICACGVPDRNELSKVTSAESALPLLFRSPMIVGSAIR